LLNDNIKHLYVFQNEPEIIRLAAMYYVRYPLSFRQVENI